MSYRTCIQIVLSLPQGWSMSQADTLTSRLVASELPSTVGVAVHDVVVWTEPDETEQEA